MMPVQPVSSDFDRAHEDWKLLQYSQQMKDRKLSIKEALICIGAYTPLNKKGHK